MKILSIQDISCYGQCSLTVALPILSSYGHETIILPSAVLSTHTSGFKNFTVLDLTNEMPKIINHWVDEQIEVDAIYTGYIGEKKQFDYVLDCKNNLLKKSGLFIVDPVLGDNGKLYPALNNDIIFEMKRICSIADYIIPNITEACFLTNNQYLEKYDREYIDKLLNDLLNLGAKNIILTGVSFASNEIGAIYYNGKEKIEYYSTFMPISYHGTGDIFSSVIIGNLLNKVDMYDNLKDSVEFIISCIKETMEDKKHSYGVKFENVLFKKMKN